jgi:non-haem Fe2+, alpha-ketoglutarate-dependent halogenase
LPISKTVTHRLIKHKLRPLWHNRVTTRAATGMTDRSRRLDEGGTQMPKALSDRQIKQYRGDGYLFPLPAFPAGEAAKLRGKLAELERREGGKVSSRTNRKPHLLLPWLNEVIRDPRILDAVEDVIGPNILCWGSGFFAKSANDDAMVSWHQDSTYWGLSEPEVVTAWVAFTPSTAESGCMRVIPGSHKFDQISHRDTFAANNLLSRGQEIEVEVDESRAVDVILEPGEMSLHHVRLVHGSAPNRADHPRIGYAIRYVPTHIRQIAGILDSATLVRGEDTYRNFALEPVPRFDFDPEAVALHAAMLENNTRILYAGAQIETRL